MSTTLAERVTALERDMDALKRTIADAMVDPQTTPAGRRSAADHADIVRRLRVVERELGRLVTWASGGR